MFGWFKRKQSVKTDDNDIVLAPFGVVFPWSKKFELTAVDDLVLALPGAIFGKNQALQEVLFGPDDMLIAFSPDHEVVYVKLQPGMSIRLTKSADAFVASEDKKSRRIKLTRIQPQT